MSFLTESQEKELAAALFNSFGDTSEARRSVRARYADTRGSERTLYRKVSEPERLTTDEANFLIASLIPHMEPIGLEKVFFQITQQPITDYPYLLKLLPNESVIA
ncbi:hypothetical protein [Runella limosa]|uniref:hypothetical protein n=1 Tax=Runella limosa TaxID=370978 RepID=UPI00048F3BDA|nr:hypothetical protein [Runella limosa]